MRPHGQRPGMYALTYLPTPLLRHYILLNLVGRLLLMFLCVFVYSKDRLAGCPVPTYFTFFLIA